MPETDDFYLKNCSKVANSITKPKPKEAGYQANLKEKPKTIMAACEGFSEKLGDRNEDSGVVEDRLMSDFTEWKTENMTSPVVLIERKDTADDGTSILSIELSKDHTFRLLCPSGYPYHEDHFYVEADEKGVKLWANALNEYLLDTDRRLGLKEVLDKAISLATSASKDSMFSENSDEEMDYDGSDVDVSEPNSEEEDCGMGSMDEDEAIYTTTWELKIARKRKRWLETEERIREEMKEKQKIPGAALTLPASRTSKQIFTSGAAYGILTNELVILMEAEVAEPMGLEVEPIDDNVYRWQVKVSDFQENSDLASDMAELKKRFGYDYIELQLEFAIDLYPFYPPLVKLVRPRLQASMMQRVTNLELLKLSYWNPARDMKSILLDVKTFLQDWGRVDLSSERNDRGKYLSGSFVEIEHHLLRLALVSETNPRANNHLLEKTPERLSNAKPTTATAAPPSESKGNGKKNKKLKNREYWQKGVGYGHGDRVGNWDIKAYMAAQKEKDSQIESVLHKIVEELKLFYANHAPQLQPRPKLNPQTGASDKHPTRPAGKRGQSNSRPGTASSAPSTLRTAEAPPTNAVATPSAVGTTSSQCVDPLIDMYKILEASALVPFLESYLKIESFLEINRHVNLYVLIIDIIRQISSIPQLLPLLLPLSEGTPCLYEYIHNLERKSSALLAQIRKAGNGTIPKPPKRDKKENASWCSDVDLYTDLCEGDDGEPLIADSEGGEDSLARAFTGLQQTVHQTLCQNGYSAVTGKLAANSHPGEPSGTSSSNKRSEEGPYVTIMRPLQNRNHDIQGHHFLTEFRKVQTTPNASQLFRIAQEVASLPSSLPVGFSSSVFVRSDDSKLVLMTALITGPSGTPYSGGCFQFDIYFPIEYPKHPPKVILRTTGNGTVRFNPNLYNCGKVCLSLLGTWAGQKGETWNPTSTVLQVLVSIQSLILVADPYFNEPGFETLIGTPAGKSQSDQYNHDIRHYTLRHAVLEQLQRPNSGYTDVIKNHFRLKADSLLKEYETWVNEATEQNRKHSKLGDLVKRVKTEFEKLKTSLPMSMGDCTTVQMDTENCSATAGTSHGAPSTSTSADVHCSSSTASVHQVSDIELGLVTSPKNDFDLELASESYSFVLLPEMDEMSQPGIQHPGDDVIELTDVDDDDTDDDDDDVIEVPLPTKEKAPPSHATFTF